MAPSRKSNKSLGNGKASAKQKRKKTASKKESQTVRNRNGNGNAGLSASSATTSRQGYLSLDKIRRVGFINEPLLMGTLRNVIEEPNRVIFEFILNGKRIDAWSSKSGSDNWGLQNKAMLKVGYSYVLQGTIRAKTKSTLKYERSSNSTFRYSFLLAQISILDEKKANGSSLVDTSNFCKIFQQLKSNKPFTLSVENVEIVSGDVKRYMGCEVCYSGLSKPSKDGKFYCYLCKKKENDSKSKNRRVCLIIRDLRLKDKDGAMLGNILCFQKQCEALFGATVANDLCQATSDNVAQKQFENLLGTIFKITIKHQGPTKSRTKSNNVAKLILHELIVIRAQTGRQPTTGYQNDEDNAPSASEKSLDVLPANATQCPCESDPDETLIEFLGTEPVCDNDDDDQGPMDVEEYVPSLPALVPSSSRNSLSDDNDDSSSHSLGFDEDSYELTRVGSRGYIGLAIIINIPFFPTQQFPEVHEDYTRHGSDINVKSLRRMFKTLRVRVFKELIDVGYQEFTNAMIEFKRELVTKKYSSFFFVLMSHGTLHTIRLRDLKRINIYKDVLPLFGEIQFPQFCGKPKIFIFNSCQYFKAQDFTDVAGLELSGEDRNLDTLLCFPCLPGIKAKRHPTLGSVYINALVKVFCGNWMKPEMEIQKMLHLVQEKMSTIPILGKFYNVPYHTPILFRYFYFARDDDDI